MQVKADGKLFVDVLKQGIFIIPDFQRPYDWSIDEISEFIDDINENINKEYFIGHMVLTYPSNKHKHPGLTCFSIIDGQQRFTTITVLLAVIRDLFHRSHEDTLRDAVNKYLFTNDNDGRELPILETDFPYPIFQKYIQTYNQETIEKTELINSISNNKFQEFLSGISTQNSAEKKLLSAYHYIYQYLKEFDTEQLKKIRDAILRLEVVFIEVGDLASAHSIFMTLNAKGKDLTFIDLIKNDIFSKYDRTQKPAEPKYLEETWKKIYTNIQQGGNEDFFLSFWKSRYAPIISKENFYKNYMVLSTDKKESFNINEFVEDLHNDSKIFNDITQPNLETWRDSSNPEKIKIYFHLNFIISYLNITKLSYAFLISLLRGFNKKKISLQYVIKALIILEKFTFINNILYSKSGTGLNKIFPKYAIQLFNSNSKGTSHSIIDQFSEQLANKIEKFDQDTIQDNMRKKIFYIKDGKAGDSKVAKKLARYCLERLEWHQKKDLNFFPTDVSIEHVYSYIYLDKINQNQIISLGNLVLLEKSVNSKLPNEYSQKRLIVESESNMLIAKKLFSTKETWDIADIEQRNQELAYQLYNMFDNNKRKGCPSKP